MERSKVGSMSVADRFAGVPEVRERNDTFGCSDQRGDVLGRVAGRSYEADRVAQHESIRIPPHPLVSLIDCPVVVKTSLAKESRIEGVIWVVMTEDDVGHVSGVEAQAPKRREDQVLMPDHPRIRDYPAIAIYDQSNCAGDPRRPVALVENGVRSTISWGTVAQPLAASLLASERSERGPPARETECAPAVVEITNIWP